MIKPTMAWLAPKPTHAAFAEVLRQAAEEFSNHGCNEFHLPNEDWAWELVQRLDMLNHNKPWDEIPEDERATRPASGDIYVNDSSLLSALARVFARGLK